jgi:hypothetical protein
MNRLLGVRFETGLSAIDIALPAEFSGVVIHDGSPAWAWNESTPPLPIESFTPLRPARIEAEWGLDHVVVTVPDLAKGIEVLVASGADFRRKGTTARGQQAGFLLAGPIIELIEVAERPVRLAGIAFETDLELGEVAARWIAAGLEPTLPHPAVQPGRSIMSLGRVAVMSRRS